MLYVDLDGVLADFDSFYYKTFGYIPNRTDKKVHWGKIKNHKNFYYNLPLMQDAMQLWEYVSRYNPTILTGIPYSIDEAVQNKKDWIKKYFGDVPVICCYSKDKSNYCQPGDIIVDDYDKYRQKWLDKGGIWILHTNAEKSIRELKEVL